MGFDLVLVRLAGTSRRTLQVMAEPLDPERRMTVEDCAELSHALSAVLDVADPIEGAYDLEVGSPGIDRPLVRLGDFTRFEGLEARVETGALVDGRKRWKGVLRGTAEEIVLIEVDGSVQRIPFAAIRKAKLVLTDALLAQAAGRGLG